jgi:hypothetical protein
MQTGGQTYVAMHTDDIPTGTFRSILKQARLTEEQFRDREGAIASTRGACAPHTAETKMSWSEARRRLGILPDPAGRLLACPSFLHSLLAR